MRIDQMFTRSREKSLELLNGTIDLNVQPGPHLLSSPRSTDPFECAREARDAGMRALVFTDDLAVSSGSAWLVEQVVDGIRCFGGIVLNTAYDSLNPRAVMNATTYGNGTRFVSFGSYCTYYNALDQGRCEDGEWVLLRDKYPKFAEDEMPRMIRIPDEPPCKELKEILEIIRDNPQIYVVSGLVSPREAMRLGELAGEFGIKKYLISSETADRMSDDEIARAIGMGAYIEREFAPILQGVTIPRTHYYAEYEYRSGKRGLVKGGVSKYAEQIFRFGAEHFICDTGLGIYSASKPIDGMREYIACFLDEGLSDEQIRLVTGINPGRLLDMND